ncbi:MAG: mlaC [Rickettsiales bacterium]|nr:mlaC [Rickettsiales bacterium]
MALSGASAHAASAENARDFVQKLGDKTISVMADKSLNDKEKEKELARLFVLVVDTSSMGKFALGKYWRVATPEQRENYLALYRQFLVGTYIPRFRNYTDQTFTITKAKPESNGIFIVQTEIVRKGNAPILVDYRVQAGSKDFMITDIVAEGVSLITTQRSEFSSFIAREGLEAFIKQLESRINHVAKTKGYLLEAVG